MRNRWVSCSVWLMMTGVAALTLGACAAKEPPVARPVPPPQEMAKPEAPPPPPPTPVRDTPVVPAPRLPDDPMSSRSIDDLNRESPLQPAFFELDSAELTPVGRTVLEADAALLKKYATWVITIEGHCDERGTAEYNSALGERRAAAAQAYLTSLGIAPERLHIVSYGKEFPFDPGHDETAWAKNRRAHFVITGK